MGRGGWRLLAAGAMLACGACGERNPGAPPPGAATPPPAATPALEIPASAPPAAASAARVGAPPGSAAAPQAVADATAPLLPSPGSLLVPVVGVEAAQLRDDFDQPRGGGRHEAIDIAAPRGTPVVAVADGRVAKLFNSKAGGLTVYQFDSSGRLAYYYAHLDAYAPALAEGALLRRGDAVGTVGISGNAAPDAPHLHFAVFVLGPERQWWKGTPVNPYPLLAGAR